MAGYYIHVPFCLSKCTYCDFCSYEHGNNSQYVDAVLKEIAYNKNNKIENIFFGGGTPTILHLTQIEKMLNQICKYNTIEKNCEITIEANPETVKNSKALFDMGINRISVGLQSGDDKVLRNIGRVHNVNTFLNAIDNIVCGGFKNINVDIMYGLPLQSIKSFENTVALINNLPITHVSAYELNVANGTKLYDQINAGQICLPSEDEVCNMTKCLDMLKFNRYEISNYAKKGYECRHNLCYWNYKDYVGIGVKASGFEKGARYSHTDSVNEYIKNPILRTDEICVSKKDQMFEYIMVGLRKIKGVNVLEFKNKFDEDLYNKLQEYININSHLICENNGDIFLTKRGLDIQNTVLCDLINYI